MPEPRRAIAKTWTIEHGPCVACGPARRPAIKTLSQSCLTLVLSLVVFASCAAEPAAVEKAYKPSQSDEAFLADFQERCFRYFWEQASPKTGLVADRAPADGGEKFDVASTAATGFGLTAVCIADERGWVSHEQAYQRVLTTLRFILNDLPNEHGFYYHFVNRDTGERAWNCELSSIDTGLLLGGVMTARQYYKGTEVERLATAIYERVDWPWMCNGGRTLTMGWSPEKGFLNATWDGYSELTILYVLGIGSAKHPMPADAWRIWKREPVITYDGMTFLACPPLFTHQFSHAFVDYRGKRDDVANYFRNSVLATQAHREMCIKLGKRFPQYSADVWGITASDYAGGYTAWGGPPATSNIDGTVVPCAAAGSVPFLPEACIHTLRYMKQHYGKKIWKRYGFVDAFNPQTGYVARDVIGIDVGISLMMIENYRSGFVWRQFMANPEVRHAMDLAGFRPETDVTDPNSSVYGLESIPSEMLAASWNKQSRTARVKPVSFGWEQADWHALTAADCLEKGQPRKDNQVSALFAFAWDQSALYVVVRVTDNDVVNTREPEQLHEQDCVELYLDPQDDGLVWGSPADFQFGFAPTDKVWEWFGGRQGEIEQTVRLNSTAPGADASTGESAAQGYEVRATIPWKLLGVDPKPGLKLQASVALHSVNTPGDSSMKLNWLFKERAGRINLGELVLE